MHCKDDQATLHVCSVMADDSLQQAKNKGINDCISKLSLTSVAYK